MDRKIILQSTLCVAIISLSFINSYAQPKRSFNERILVTELRPGFNHTQKGGHNSKRSPHRSYDGTNNNISRKQTTEWGAADILLFREIPAQYGPSNPKNAMGGINRPSARAISNVLIDEPVTIFTTRGLSTLLYQWGQFLDHEMTLTPTDTTEYVPISLPEDETIFTEEIPFYRSEFTTETRFRDFAKRQQINLNTSWIDGSAVYGSDSVRARWLRTLSNGKMKMSAGSLLPFNTTTSEYSAGIDPDAPAMKNDLNRKVKTFVAGDGRAAENPVLTSIHTLFVREHNRICDKLMSEGLKNDELIYQSARKEVGALIQAITYQEFLPALGVKLHRYPGYNSYTRPDITNTFATAAYRLGHTMVSDDVLLIDNDCAEVPPGALDLIEAFWNPKLVMDHGIESFIKGSASHDQYETDTKINGVLRNFLFGDPGSPVRFGIDLGSLNIQRGRDHGLPDYNSVRSFYTGKSAAKYSDITSNDTVANSLKKLYSNINDIDLWVGVLSEDHLPGRSVGNTLHEMLKTQFEKLRNGDFYFYLNDPYLPPGTRHKIKNTTFSALIKRNTTLTNLADNVFFTQECPGKMLARSAAGNHINLKDPELKLYPNPTKDLVKIDLGSVTESAIIYLYAANGLLVKTFTCLTRQRIIQININDLPNGGYTLVVQAGRKNKSLKILKLAN